VNRNVLAVVFILLCVSGLACPALAFLNVRVNSDNSGQLHNEEQIVVNPLDSNNVVAVWRDFRLGYRRIGAGYSLDGGRTWHDTLLEDSHYPWHSDPGLTVDVNGNFYVVILSYTSTSQPNGLYVQTSTDGGRTWGPSVTVVDEHNPSNFEDKELIACDRGDSSQYRGNLYVAWARFYATDIMLCRSTDTNQTWSLPTMVSDGSASRQWPTPAVGPDGSVYVAWSDFSQMAIMLDKSTNGGVTWGADRVLQNVTFGSGYVQPSVTVFSFPALDVDVTGGPHRGWLHCAYMDDAVSGGGTDIYFTRSTDGGATWSTRLKINDDPDAGKDHFHPWLCVDRNGDITVTWYDRRDDPSNMLMHIYLTQSYDGGTTWTPNLRVTTVSSDPNIFPALDEYRPGQPRPFAGRLGEYNGLWAVSRDRIFAMWADTRDGSPNIYAGIDSTVSAVAGPGPKQLSRLNASPNPFSGRVTIAGASGPIRIYSPDGRLLRTLTPPASAVPTPSFTSDCSSLPAGVYLARGGAGSTSLRLVKAR